MNRIDLQVVKHLGISNINRDIFLNCPSKRKVKIPYAKNDNYQTSAICKYICHNCGRTVSCPTPSYWRPSLNCQCGVNRETYLMNYLGIFAPPGYELYYNEVEVDL